MHAVNVVIRDFCSLRTKNEHITIWLGVIRIRASRRICNFYNHSYLPQTILHAFNYMIKKYVNKPN